VLGLFYTAYFAREILIPITVAFLLSFLFAPAARSLTKWLHVPRPFAAFVLVASFVAVLVVAFSILATPAEEWMGRLPGELSKIERMVSRLGAPVRDVQEAAKQVEEIAQGPGTGRGDPLPVVVKGPSLTEMFLGQTFVIVLGSVVTILLLLFFIGTGDNLLRRAVSAAPKLSHKVKVVEISREVEDEISHYFFSISLINAAAGIAVGTTMWLLDMPNPALWGALAGILNFIPVVGPLTCASVIALVSIITFDTPLAAALPPSIYLCIHVLESQVITPLLLARRLVLNPLAVLLSIILWTWMWGVAGALLAVPILATLKIVCDHIEGLRPLAVLLGRLEGKGKEPGAISA
jgi:predicted PurR-regulated permease PerM